MPIYPYQCKSCGYVEDKFYMMSSLPDINQKFGCEKCGEQELVRQFCVPNVNDGPKTLGSQSELNLKKFGNPFEKTKEEKKADEYYKHIQKVNKIKDKERYIMTGEMT